MFKGAPSRVLPRNSVCRSTVAMVSHGGCGGINCRPLVGDGLENWSVKENRLASHGGPYVFKVHTLLSPRIDVYNLDALQKTIPHSTLRRRIVEELWPFDTLDASTRP